LSYIPEKIGELPRDRTRWYSEEGRGYSPLQSPMLLAIHVLEPHRRLERRTSDFVGRRSVQMS